MPSSCAVAHEDGFAARDGERSSKPGPDAEYKTGASRLLAFRTRIARSVPNFSVIGYADIGRELAPDLVAEAQAQRSEEHTSELQSLMRNSYAVFCLNKKK